MDIKNDWFIDTSRSNPISQGSFKFVTLTARSIILSMYYLFDECPLYVIIL